jgi:Fur family peroxide stress response transcriptional regulator
VQDIELDKLNFLDEKELINFKTFTEEELKDNKIDSVEINFYGICGECLKEEKE